MKRVTTRQFPHSISNFQLGKANGTTGIIFVATTGIGICLGKDSGFEHQFGWFSWFDDSGNGQPIQWALRVMIRVGIVGFLCWSFFIWKGIGTNEAVGVQKAVNNLFVPMRITDLEHHVIPGVASLFGTQKEKGHGAVP